MTNVWCVRAEFGQFTDAFLKGGYVAIGWLDKIDLSSVTGRENLYPLYRDYYPEDKSNVVVGQQVGQIARFLFDISPGDTVITPSRDTEILQHGIVLDEPYVFESNDPTCPYPHRRVVKWAQQPIRRSSLSVPLGNTMRSSLTVFSVSQVDEVLELAGRGELVKRTLSEYDPYESVLERVLALDDKEFEILIGHLLTALGFEGSEVTGKIGDGGVDVTGELNVANLAKIKLFVQAKRYKRGARIPASTVKALRSSIPANGQGAFITTADFQTKALDVAFEHNFPRIGLVNGRQLVDLLVEYWSDIPQEFRDRLGLKPGLVLS
ncbi:restriction endonuclease [Marimonas arenosa]|uniref:Restriction endonuclease n=1 Tax=Marimonas arenosa TaxID=1795305 RepID=A0AAE3WBP5_9RHOB|nr:restriction endonuclease [Marimonas arenosa]MDQ2089757.1 restriction endonuclease [Marimonas arenosa]